MKMIDFSGYPVGMVVERSAHYQKNRCQKGKPQIGIITGFEIYENDSKTQIQRWPVVAWEGVRTGPSCTNPCLVDVRKKDRNRVQYLEYKD